MDFTSLLKVVAPWLGTALGGPLGGMAVEAVSNALGLSDKTSAGIKQALSGATPEQMLALKQADIDFSIKMQELGFKQVTDLEGLAASDRKDARSMQVAHSSKVPAILTITITVGYLGLLAGMMMGQLHVGDSPVAQQLIGSLTTGWATCLAFWFGTTRDSARKTELLAQSAPAN